MYTCCHSVRRAGTGVCQGLSGQPLVYSIGSRFSEIWSLKITWMATEELQLRLPAGLCTYTNALADIEANMRSHVLSL